MQDKKLKIALIVGAVGLVLALAGLLFVQQRYDSEAAALLNGTQTEPTSAAAEETTEATATENTEISTGETTEETTGETTEPGPERFVLTFVGDCTLGSPDSSAASSYSFVGTVGDNYDFPFDNVREYFENDDFTMVNLESVLADSGTAASKTFTFRGPTAYTNILTGSSVEAVTLANNHTMDFGTAGYTSTKSALEGAGVTYVEADGSALYTTESGLTIGLYAANFSLDKADMKKEIAALRDAGAEIVVVAFHWGAEGSYRATVGQTEDAYACIDAGADIVYGHHPHVLQRIEEYNGGIIYYSLGNFSFGGNMNPRDTDSVVLQQEIIRELDGTVRLGELTLIPVSISSVSGRNNYQPIPLEAGTEAYDRALSKLNGTFNGPDLIVDYSHLENPTEEPTEAPTEDPTEGTGGDATEGTTETTPEIGEPTEPTTGGEPTEGTEAPAPSEGGSAEGGSSDGGSGSEGGAAPDPAPGGEG